MKKTLDDWLTWQETLHLSEIDLGLDRISRVAKELNLDQPHFPIITVAGTNGKGSTVAFVESILRAEGYKTGAFTSPHLVAYNERIVLNGVMVSDECLIDAFVAIDKARCSVVMNHNPQVQDTCGEVSLTYFEFSALAAVYIFQQQAVDVAILEVGLGGRLDAANLWDATLAIISSIAIDHVDWLGDDRERIGVEKAGVMRDRTPVICGDTDPPKSIGLEANRIGAVLQQIDHDFSFIPPRKKSLNQWSWTSKDCHLTLNLPSMTGDFQFNNAACAIAGLLAISKVLPVSVNSINKGLMSAQIMGRLQRLQESPEWLVDVAHNPHAAKQLSNYICANPVSGKTIALFSMLKDKDVKSVLASMEGVIDEWHIVATEGSRGLSLEDLRKYINNFNQLKKKSVSTNEQNNVFSPLNFVTTHENFSDACIALKKITKEEDRVVAFGSFLVVSEILMFWK